MLAWDIIKFLKQYGEPDIHIGDIQQCYDFFFNVINAGQTVFINDKDGKLAAAALYFKVRNLDEVRRKRGSFNPMRSFRHGHIVYLHTLVIRPDFRGNGVIWKVAKELRKRELLCDTIAYTFNKNEHWTYKIERRREKMRDNCGIIALDALLKELNLNMTSISLDTLSKICRDNGRLMFPLKVPKKKITSLQFPYIMQTNNHYEVIEDETALEGADMGENVYLLYPQLNTTVIPHVIDEDEAKQVKGSGGGGVKNIPIIGPYLSKPARALPLAIGAGANMLGVGPTMSNILSTATGAGQGAMTGLWGEPGAGSMLTGGVQGLGQGILGQGLGGGISNWMNPLPNTTFNQGFMQNLGEAIPYGQKLGNQLGINITPYNYSPAITAAPSSASSFLTNNYQPMAPLAQQLNQAYNQPFAPTTATAGEGLPKWAAGLGDLLGGGGGGQPPTGPGVSGLTGLADEIYRGVNPGSAAAVTQEASNKMFDLKSMFPQALAMLAGNVIPQPVYDVPNYSDIYRQIMSDASLTQGITQAGKAAQTAVLNNITDPNSILQQNTDAWKTAVTNDVNRREAVEIARARTMHAQNGTSGGSDEMRDIQTIQDKYRDYLTQTLGTVDQQAYQTKAQVYLQSISDAYGMDTQALNTISGLTNASVNEAAIKYGIKAQQVKEFRDALEELIRSGSGGAQQTTAASLLAKIIGAK